MGELLGGIVAVLIWLLILPIILLAVLFGLALAGVGIAIGLAFTVLGIVIELLVTLAPLIVIIGLLYYIFRPAEKRNPAAQ